MRLAALIIVIAIVAGCTPPQVRTGDAGAARIIYHANLETIYTYQLSRNSEGQKLRELRQSLDNRKRSQPTGSVDLSLDEEYNKLSKHEEALKNDLYQKIKQAVKRIAGRQSIDCILDSSRCLIYYTSEGDITEQVIRELDMLDVRSQPVSR